MHTIVDSVLHVKASENVDVSKDLEKAEGKDIKDLIDDQEKEDQTQTTK
jgi:hypothetical protein